MSLADTNSTTLGTKFPEIVLPNGEKVQTGTVGALLVNIKAYDELVSMDTVDQSKKEELEARMKAALPLLKKVGMFDLFSAVEWKAGASPGRKFVGEQAEMMGF